MDPYDVLGLRRNASAQEIELAYRGRRTQYHPDRYQGSDAETLQWATDKMKEVNALHAILSDPAKRAAYDQGGARARSGAAAPPTAAPPSQSQMGGCDLAMALRAVAHRARGFDRVFLAPNIPMHKLSPALGSYGRGLEPEDVLALVDSTVFGGAKEGFMFTESGIRYKELGQSPGICPWKDVQRMEASASKIFINAHPFMNCSVVHQREFDVLFEAVDRFLDGRSGRGAEPERAKPAATPSASRSNVQAEQERPPFDQLFKRASEAVINLERFLKNFEIDDTVMLDRESVVVHFEYFAKARDAEDPQMRTYVRGQLGQIIELCEVWPQVMRDPSNAVGLSMMKPLKSDTELVGHLRELLTWIKDFTIAAREHNQRLDEESQARARVDAFFKGS